MATQVQFRGGTTAQHNSFNGAAREVTVDTTKNTLVVQDGTTNGGFPLLKEKNADNVKLNFGNSDDLKVYHSGNESWIKDTGTGNLFIATSATRFVNSGNTATQLKTDEGGAVELFFNGSTRAETTSSGFQVNGEATLGQNSGDEVLVSRFKQGGNYLDIKRIRHTAGSIWQTTSTRIEKTTQNTKQGYIEFNGENNSAGVQIGTQQDNTTSELSIRCIKNGDTELYHNGVKKFGTNQNGSVTYGIKHQITNPGGSAYLQVGQGATGNNYAYIDLIGDTTYSTYGLRLMRKEGGANTASQLIHRGTGQFQIACQDAAAMKFRTNATDALTIDSSQNATFGGSINSVGELNFTGAAHKYINFATQSGNTNYNTVFRTMNNSNAGHETALILGRNGPVEAYFDGVKKFETHGNGCTCNGTLNTGDLNVGSGTSTDSYMHIGSNPQGNKYAFIDLIGDTTYTDYGLRLMRNNGGANTNSQLSHRGTGDFEIKAQDAGRVKLSTNNIPALTIASNQAAAFSSTVSCTALTETSDIALKTNIEPITNVLDKINQITGYKYDFTKSNSSSMGVIAQDVEKVFPELVHGEEGSKSLQYSGLIGALIESVKELSAKVTALESN